MEFDADDARAGEAEFLVEEFAAGAGDRGVAAEGAAHREGGSPDGVAAAHGCAAEGMVVGARIQIDDRLGVAAAAVLGDEERGAAGGGAGVGGKFFGNEVEAVGIDAVDHFDPDAINCAVGVFGDLEEFGDAALAGAGRRCAVGGCEAGAVRREGAFVGGGAGEIGREGKEGAVDLG